MIDEYFVFKGNDRLNGVTAKVTPFSKDDLRRCESRPCTVPLQISAGGAGTAFTEFRRGTFLREDQAFSGASSSGWGSSEVQLGHLTASIAMVLLQ